MSKELWTAVDRYMTDCLLPPDSVLEAVMKANAAADLPAISVAPNQGKLLYLLARIQGATRILEIGTLGGYSTIWLARALPSGGKLVTLEFSPKHAAIAAGNIERAGLSSLVELRVGAALESLAQLQVEGAAAFDFIFIDADKANIPKYLAWAIHFARSGTIILVDNVVREGGVVEPSNPDPSIQGVRQFFEMMKSEPRLDATALQTVGSKGYDGFALAVVR